MGNKASVFTHLCSCVDAKESDESLHEESRRTITDQDTENDHENDNLLAAAGDGQSQNAINIQTDPETDQQPTKVKVAQEPETQSSESKEAIEVLEQQLQKKDALHGQQIDDYKRLGVQLQQQMASYYVDNESLRAENERLKTQYTEQNQSHPDTNVILSLDTAQRQQELLHDAMAKVKSMYLCCNHVSINGEDLSFTHWLSARFTAEDLKEIWTKLSIDACGNGELLSLLVMIVVSYNQQLQKLRAPNNDEAEHATNAAIVSEYVQHLSVWIITNKGTAATQDAQEEICIKSGNGSMLNKRAHRYMFSCTENVIAQNISGWVHEYLEAMTNDWAL